VVAEHRFHVKHCLMAPKGVRIEDVKKVRSHPQALAQCASWLRERRILPEDFYDTAGAAASLIDHDRDDAPEIDGKSGAVAAIASAGAATRYGLEVLASGIEDAKGNTTRFLLVAKSQKPEAGLQATPAPVTSGRPVQWRTSMVFAPRSNVPGALFKALSVFALRDIDLTKLESRPATPGVHYDPSSLKRFAHPSGQWKPFPPAGGATLAQGAPSSTASSGSPGLQPTSYGAAG